MDQRPTEGSGVANGLAAALLARALLALPARVHADAPAADATTSDLVVRSMSYNMLHAGADPDVIASRSGIIAAIEGAEAGYGSMLGYLREGLGLSVSRLDAISTRVG